MAMMTFRTKAGTSALSVLVRKIPDVVRFLIERLDAAVTVHDHDPGDPDCEIRLDFRYESRGQTGHFCRTEMHE